MLQKFMITARPWQKYMINFAIYIMLCIATLGFILCIGAFAITRIDTPDYILIPLTTIMLTCASFTDAFLLGKVYKENGFATGLAVGLIFCAIITLVAVKYGIFAFTNLYISKAAAVLFAGILGGIAGVNI